MCPAHPGLSAVLQGNDLATMLRKLPDTPFLRVLASGAPVQDASAVLGARPFRHVLDSLRAVRLVVVDTPPAAMFADAMAVASQCDATIFVLDVKTSRRRQVRQTLEALERAGANLVGVVVNRTASPRRSVVLLRGLTRAPRQPGIPAPGSGRSMPVVDDRLEVVARLAAERPQTAGPVDREQVHRAEVDGRGDRAADRPRDPVEQRPARRGRRARPAPTHLADRRPRERAAPPGCGRRRASARRARPAR